MSYPCYTFAMHAFEAAVNELALQQTDHVMIAGILPTWHELLLVIQRLDVTKGSVLIPQADLGRAKHMMQSINQQGLAHAVIAYQGMIDAPYGAIVKEESVDALLYVPQKSDDIDVAAQEIKRIVKHGRKVAIIEQTPAHPLAKGIVLHSVAAALQKAGFSLVHTATAARTHTVSVLVSPKSV